MSKGRTLKVFLVDGTPHGLLTAEIMNWTGHVLTGPRSRLSELIQRPEVMRTGVYFLVGADSGNGISTQVYIGETDDVARRLKDHNAPENKEENKGGKDFWEKVCVVTSKDANLTKGHVKYLESRLIAIARTVGRSELQNHNEPLYANLPEADRSDMEFFLDQIQTLLPVLGFDFLRAMPKTSVQTEQDGTTELKKPSVAPTFVGDVKKYGITARGQEIEGEFVVMKGSRTRKQWEGGDEDTYARLFKDLVKTGILISSEDGQYNVFSRDHAFSSPSAAAAVVAGRSANGRTHWTLEGSHQTYGAWQEEQVSNAVAAIANSTDGAAASSATN